VFCLSGHRFQSWIVLVNHCFLTRPNLRQSFRATFKQYDRQRSSADARYEEERRKREAAEAAWRHAKEEADTARRHAEEERRKREEAEATQRRAQEAQQQREEAEAVRHRTAYTQRQTVSYIICLKCYEENVSSRKRCVKCGQNLHSQEERQKSKITEGYTLSVNEAAQAIGVNRWTMQSYINSGRINVNPDGTIDTDELLQDFIIRNLPSRRGW